MPGEKNEQQGTDLEFRVGYSIFGEVSPGGLRSVGLDGDYKSDLVVKALNGSEAQEKVRGVLDSKLKTVAKFYNLKVYNAIQLGDPSQISSLSQYVTNMVEERFGGMKSGSYVPPDWPEHSELSYDNPRFPEQLIPLVLNAVHNKQEVGLALDLVAERIERDGPHTVGPDTQHYGFAGNAYVTYVRTFPALHFAEDTATMRKLIREKAK